MKRKMSKQRKSGRTRKRWPGCATHGFDVTEAPGMSGRVFLRKYNVSAAIQKTPEDGVKVFAHPGYLIGSEISKLVNRGYQQFLKTSKNGSPRHAPTISRRCRRLPKN